MKLLEDTHLPSQSDRGRTCSSVQFFHRLDDRLDALGVEGFQRLGQASSASDIFAHLDQDHPETSTSEGSLQAGIGQDSQSRGRFFQRDSHRRGDWAGKLESLPHALDRSIRLGSRRRQDICDPSGFTGRQTKAPEYAGRDVSRLGEIELAGRSETEDLRESLMNFPDVEAGLSQEAHSLSRLSSRECGRRSKFFGEIGQTLELFTSRSADRLYSQH